MTDLSKRSIFVFDVSGMYFYQAKRFLKDFGEVNYYVPNEEDSYLMADRDEMGTGVEGIHRVYNFWSMINVDPSENDIDCFWFPDVGYGSLQRHLENLGYRVGGSKSSEILEIDKLVLHKALKRCNLPVPNVKIVDNFDDLQTILKKTTDKWIKVGWKHRGIFETRHHIDWKNSEEWFYSTCAKIGKHRDNMLILVYDPIPSKAEVAIDGFRLGRQVVPGMLTGIELKDMGFSGMFVREMPDVIAKVENRLDPEFDVDYNGAYGNEIRLGEDGLSYYIDATCRTGRPPGAALYTGITNISQVVWDICSGEMPYPEWEKKYVANILMFSPILCKQWLKVEYPESISDFVHLSNHCKKDDGWYCIPDGSGDTDTVAEVIGLGDTMEEAQKQALKHARMVKAEKLEFKENLFDEIGEKIETAKEYGIHYSGG